MNAEETYALAHEFKTPMTNIRGFANLLAREETGPPNEEQKVQIKIIIEESKKVEQAICKLMDAAK